MLTVLKEVRPIHRVTMADSRDVPEGAQFGLANIPFGVVSTVSDPSPKAATRLHDRVFLLPGLIERGLLSGVDEAIQKSLQTVSRRNPDYKELNH